MGKKIIISIVSFLALLLLVNCQEDGFSFGSLDTPTNLNVSFELIGKTADNPNGDGSGKVKFTSTADNAISYKYSFPDGTFTSDPSGVYTKTFTVTGLNKYTVVVLATGKGGVTTNTTIEVEVLSNFTDPDAVTFLTGNSDVGVKWYWSQSEGGHLGVGPNSPEEIDANTNLNYRPSYYAAPPDGKKETCLYNSVMTFSLDADGNIKFNLDNKGNTYFNAAYLDVPVGGSGTEDTCFPFDTSGTKTVNLGPSESFVAMNPNHATQTRGTMLNFSDGGFMGYYLGATSYEILSITANRMEVRCVDSRNPALAWYHIFTTIPPGGGPPPPDDFTVLKFSDEFNTDGAPDPTKWIYDTGNNSGWGNNEEQFYTTRASNIKVTGGNLVITAKKEIFSGFNYTSSRIKTEGLYNFTYGKIEFKAKMPIGVGTWPAIWSLGSNHSTVTWPACGEIDYLEHVGKEQNKIFGSLHYPGFSGGSSKTGSKVISNASTQFHVYKVIWNSANVRFYVDDVVYYTFSNSSVVPFNHDFFLIMNVAMGGNFGGIIDPAFTESSMEVDYIRVYQ